MLLQVGSNKNLDHCYMLTYVPQEFGPGTE